MARKPADDEPLEARIVDDDEEDDEEEPAYRAETVRQRLERRTRTLATLFAALRTCWWGFNVLVLLGRDDLILGTLNSRKLETVFQETAFLTAAVHGAVSTLALAVIVDQVLRHLHRLIDPVPATPRA